MGPTALFDKSFLQSLSLDESVLFDCNLHQNRVTRAALQNPELVKRINRFMEAPALPPEQVDWEPGEAEAVDLQRTIRKRKGSFWQVPKDVADAAEKQSS